MAITAGTGANLIFDPIGGPLLQTLAGAAAVGATIVEYGALSPDPTPFPLFSALKRGLAVRGYTLFEIAKDAERLARGVRLIRRRNISTSSRSGRSGMRSLKP
ncbi:MAG: hypothetical protein O6933_07785 [Planctomycetota bacterium]|nr:hypothetical protein [Planctomycetota bacterium]